MVVRLTLVGSALALAGCRAETPDPEEAAPPDSVVASAAATPADSGFAADSGTVASVPIDRPEGPPEPLLYRLLLINPSESEAHVFATAGAGTVVVDTVPARDSVRVDLRLRAWSVVLEADDPDGRPVGAAEIELDPARLNRWVVTGGGR